MVFIDFDIFFDGFGLWFEIVFKIKEMGFIVKILMFNVDEFLFLLELIN